MGKMRVTSHNGRWCRGGAYSTKHNDRNFDVEKEPHIQSNKSNDNLYWDCYNGFNRNEKGNTINQVSFDEVEKIFYEENFNEYLQYRNQKYIKRRQYKNVWTADDYRKRKNSCPEETIYQIGKQGETVDAEILKNVFLDFKMWHEKEFPQVKILNFALHLDEATPHIQMRRVWVTEDENGKKYVSQTKVLEKMCVKKPNQEKETHRWNNPKQTFTAQCRKKIIELCEGYGLEIEREPQESSKVGLSLIEYQRQREEEKLKNLQNEIEKMNTEIQNKKEELENITQEIDNKSNELKDFEIEIDNRKNEKNNLIIDNKKLKDEIKQIVEPIENYKDQWLQAKKTKNYKQELKTVMDFVAYYKGNGRQDYYDFYAGISDIANNIRKKETYKNNSR